MSMQDRAQAFALAGDLNPAVVSPEEIGPVVSVMPNLSCCKCCACPGQKYDCGSTHSVSILPPISQEAL